MPAADPILRPAAEISTLRARVAELEASRARLAAFVRAEDAYASALSRSWEGQISRARGEKALARAALTAQDLAPETPHG